jgi:hypothetical protein
MEYDQIHDMFKGSLTTVLPNAEVVRIERIQNPRLHQIYEGQKKTMSNGGNEMRLFHGTAKTAVQNINTTGFNRSYCGKNGKVFTLVLVKRANLANSPISAHSAFAEKNRLGLDLFVPQGRELRLNILGCGFGLPKERAWPENNVNEDLKQSSLYEGLQAASMGMHNVTKLSGGYGRHTFQENLQSLSLQNLKSLMIIFRLQSNQLFDKIF